MENYNNAIKHINENFKSVKEIAKLIGIKNDEQLANELMKYSDLEVEDKNDGFGDPNYLVRKRPSEKTTYTHNEQNVNINGKVKRSNFLVGEFAIKPQEYEKDDKHNAKEIIYKHIVKLIESVLKFITNNKLFTIAITVLICLIYLSILLSNN